MNVQRIAFRGKELLCMSGDSKTLTALEILSEGDALDFRSKAERVTPVFRIVDFTHRESDFTGNFLIKGGMLFFCLIPLV